MKTTSVRLILIILFAFVFIFLSSCATTGQSRTGGRDSGEVGGAATKTPKGDTARQGGAGSYTVSNGDSLWRISGKHNVYGNPYQWPLIFRANNSQIKDADLIFPRQRFSIPHDITSSQTHAAVMHAKTRGHWTLGVAEDSDMAYLRKN